MTGAASTSIQISYSTEDGGITTEEIVGFGESEFLAELEDVEEYPLTYEPKVPATEVVLNNTSHSKLIKPSIELELKMVTLITENNCDGVRIVVPEEDMASPSAHNSHSMVSHLHEHQTTSFQEVSEREESIISELSLLPEMYHRLTKRSTPVVSVSENAESETNSAKDQETIESCVRESIELCLGNGVFELNAEDIVTDDCGQDRRNTIEETSLSSPLTDARPKEYHSLTVPYDGPPILSPNYEVEDRTETVCGSDEQPPALTKELEGAKQIRRGRGRPPGQKRKRSPKQPKTAKSKTASLCTHITEEVNGNSPSKGHNKDAPALHRTPVPVVIPHSSAEIQERVKNRQRKTTQSYGTAIMSEDAISEALLDGDKPVLKPKPRRRKLSSESSNSETKSKKVKPQSQNGLFIVEKILKKGIINGHPYFYVKWLNYPSSKNTWEPEENFSLDLIAAYEKKVSETGQLVKVIDGVDINHSPPEFKSVMRSISVKPQSKVKCPGCMSYPYTFTDNRNGRNGFDEGLTYHKTLESFLLEDDWCALVEFDEKHALELIPLTIINDRLKSEIKLH